MKSSEEIRGQRQGTPPAQEVEVVEEEEVVARDRAGAHESCSLGLWALLGSRGP